MIRAAAALLALAPGLAYANAGIGYFVLALPIVVVALIPAIPLEGLVLAGVLRVPLRRAMMLSLRANLRSTLWGVVLGIGADFLMVGAGGSAGPEPTKRAAMAILVPFFFLSWWIERRAVARLATELSLLRIGAATGAANLLSYAAMIAFVWMTPFLPEHGTMSTRMRISEAVLGASDMRTYVIGFWQDQKRFPADPKELALPVKVPEKYDVALEPGGRITIRILNSEDSEVSGKRIMLTPLQDSAAQGGLRWECISTEISPRYLPPSCRAQAK